MTCAQVHKFAVARLYGDSASDVLQKLYSSPAATIPVVLARLEQKVDEWAKARSDMQVKMMDVRGRALKCFSMLLYFLFLFFLTA